jgi:small-conductance mechanosensitive channel|tara:strand:+ start:2026 stop:3327 length:1302 start_codon:yes stop_codon:yes gene_type:complete
LENLLDLIRESLTSQHTYIQLTIIMASFVLALITANLVSSKFRVFIEKPEHESARPQQIFLHRIGHLNFPIFSLLFLKISSELILTLDQENWLIAIAIAIALVFVYTSFVREFVSSPLVAKVMLFIGVPLLLLQALGGLPYINGILETVSVNVGNINVSLAGVLRVAVFGSFVFWLGRISSNTGQALIRNQEKIDFRTREVAAKLFEIGIFVTVFLLLMQIMGINLTALAVFGGAVGVGLGFGLQTIASNFISGLIILLDRSLSIGDFVELEDGRSGFVTALNMRSTTLETFDGKDIMVPNEMFIASTFVNWTHKNHKQRYRVDFSVAYETDIRKLVEVIKEAVATHPQVLSGGKYPIEERPDCEIDSFGDSGVNMFVEFWIEAIDDGKNRVGGDLLLIIFEAMRENGFSIPFPQREIRILDAESKPAIKRTG